MASKETPAPERELDGFITVVMGRSGAGARAPGTGVAAAGAVPRWPRGARSLPSPAAGAGCPRGLAAPVSSSLAAFVLETHVCLGARSGWKGHSHFIAHG